MPLKIAKRGNIPPFIVMDVMREAEKRESIGEDVIHMEVGQPGTSAPPLVLQAAHDALEQDVLGYTLAFGIEPLRERISQHYRNFYGLDVARDRIAITTGSSCGFILAFLSAFDAGDRVAIANPGYPAYRNILKSLGVNPVCIPVGPESNFQPTPRMLEAVEGKLEGLIIASPSNPTGTMILSDEMRILAKYCQKQSIRLISDEIYHGITYNQRATSALEFSEDAIIVNSFSKYFSMTGWRLGWMVLPKSLTRSVECLAQNLFISPPKLSQVAGIAAFDSIDYLDNHVANYRKNRDFLLDTLPKSGFHKLSQADGAFYLYADVSHMTSDSEEFCQRCLMETGVAITPGIDFDPYRGKYFARFSFAGPHEKIVEAVKRLGRWKN